jgi:phage/plasmid-associated DNA primase
VSKAIETEYLGLDYPCRDIQDFFNSIFDDQHTVEYVQRLLGYGITGHTREQKFVIMTGVGSNGKGTCFSLLLCHVCYVHLDGLKLTRVTGY